MWEENSDILHINLLLSLFCVWSVLLYTSSEMKWVGEIWEKKNTTDYKACDIDKKKTGKIHINHFIHNVEIIILNGRVRDPQAY